MGGPALLDAQADRLLPRHNAMMTVLACHAIGGLVSDGGTTQATGANGALNFDIDTTAIIQSLVDGEVHALAAQVDADATAGAGVAWGATSGKEVKAAVVLTAGSGNDTPAIEVVVGDVADENEGVEPSVDDIDTALGHDNWAPLAMVTIVRTGDLVVTFSADNSWRYGAVQGEYRKDLAETEAEFRETSPTVP
jgi:hypothetical protein